MWVNIYDDVYMHLSIYVEAYTNSDNVIPGSMYFKQRVSK